MTDDHTRWLQTLDFGGRNTEGKSMTNKGEMKIVVEEKDGEGLQSFMGKPVTLWCMNYIYSGTLVGLNETCAKLHDAALVYETGPFSTPGWKDAQALPGGVHYVQLAAIESFGGVK